MTDTRESLSNLCARVTATNAKAMSTRAVMPGELDYLLAAAPVLAEALERAMEIIEFYASFRGGVHTEQARALLAAWGEMPDA